MKIPRNQICPFCDSGKKFKRCCGDPARQPPEPTRVDIEAMLAAHHAREVRRQEQQGKGKPIISAVLNGTRMVAVGNTVFHSQKWQVFNDFLDTFIRHSLGEEWCSTEAVKPPEQQHPIVQWRRLFLEFVQTITPNEAGHRIARPTGAASAYLGLAYSLYLIKHNAELLDHMLNRLRDVGQFQGAYYELVMINNLARSGFVIELEDETNRRNRHCELYARSMATGKLYSVEVKARGVDGLLGRKLGKDGSPASEPATKNIRKHLSDALRKPSRGERIVFIDLNTAEGADGNEPSWLHEAMRQLENKERQHPNDPPAYVIVTNFCYHHYLTSEALNAVAPFGYHIPDFAKVGYITLRDQYLQRRKHADIFAIIEQMQKYTDIPTTFDGTLPSEMSGLSVERRPRINQPYEFRQDSMSLVGQSDFEPFIGVVSTAIAVEEEMRFYIGTQMPNGAAAIFIQPMTEQQLIDYKSHKDTYFDVLRPAGRKLETPYDLFAFLVDNFRDMPREKLLEMLKPDLRFEELQKLPTEELVFLISDRHVAAVIARSGEN